MPEKDKAYYCLGCQVPTGFRSIQAGEHQGHFITEFQGGFEQPSDNSLLRRFREKIEAARHNAHILLKRHF